ncbi:pilus assembly FimT family protein [Haliea sp. E17]|uniref:pilus assembly FimT family protein n=1 Tax=Haliea sp. E17 TaxID=3401576 RepID=UPI003AAF8AF5
MARTGRRVVMVKIGMWVTGIAEPAGRCPGSRIVLHNSPAIRERGFTLLEIMVAIAVVALLLAVSIPGTQRMYQSMQYRESLRDALAIFTEARREALDSGRAQDVEIEPASRSISLNQHRQQLPEGFSLGVTAAGELMRQGIAVIRFYPEGGSTGGDVEITAPSGQTTRLTVDWLMGSVRQSTDG